MQNTIVLIFILAVCAVQCQYWKLVWSDEFDGTAVDTKKWTFEEKCNVQNNELQCYTARQQNARVANGKLSIIALVENYGGKKYTSARLNTRQTASWLYGRFEMSAKLPKGKHLWPAFWMLPTDYKYGSWAASGEIDIMEYRGQETNISQGTLHYGGAAPNNAYQGSGSVNMNVDLSAGYHVYAVEWEKDEIRWYFDQKMFHRMPLTRSFFSGRGTNPYTATRQPFDQRFNFVINLAVGGAFFPEARYGTFTTQDAAAWPDNSYDIDYIRAYEPSTTPPPSTSKAAVPPATSAARASTTVQRVSTTVQRQESSTSPEIDTGGGDLGNVEINSEEANPNKDKVLGMKKPIVGIIFGAIGLLIIILVVGAVIMYRRRVNRSAAGPSTELSVAGDTLTSVAVVPPEPVVGRTYHSKYSDGEFYPATVEAIHGSSCLVNFGPEYSDEKCWIEVTDTKPL